MNTYLKAYQDLIDKIKAEKAQIAGAIMEQGRSPQAVSMVDILEAKADLCDSLIELISAIQIINQK